MKQFFALCIIFMHFSVFAAELEVRDIRLWRAPDHTRVVLDLSGASEHTIFELSNPERVVLDLKDTRLKSPLLGVALEDTPIQSIRSGIRAGSNLRLVFDLSARILPKSFSLPPNEQKGHRLVLDFFDIESVVVDVKPEPTKSADTIARDRNVLIAIDAGHGGEDPGASGPNKLQEKDLVLQIATRLYKSLNRQNGFEPILIRSGDYYVSLQGRRNKARERQADLFISIHADAFHIPSASGASVYALSTSGATSTAAQYLADAENATDLVGGVAVAEMDETLAGILTDLSMSGTLELSLKIGAEILAEMGEITKLHKKQVEQAGFAVLKSPDVPSILIETGFISNPREASLLADPNHQEKMALAIRRGILRWFTDNPPPGTLLASKQTNLRYSHIVISGDTLSQIAQRYAVSVDQIRKENALRSDILTVGEVLVIPGEDS